MSINYQFGDVDAHGALIRAQAASLEALVQLPQALWREPACGRPGRLRSAPARKRKRQVRERVAADAEHELAPAQRHVVYAKQRVRYDAGSAA